MMAQIGRQRIFTKFFGELIVATIGHGGMATFILSFPVLLLQ